MLMAILAWKVNGFYGLIVVQWLKPSEGLYMVFEVRKVTDDDAIMSANESSSGIAVYKI